MHTSYRTLSTSRGLRPPSGRSRRRQRGELVRPPWGAEKGNRGGDERERKRAVGFRDDPEFHASTEEEMRGKLAVNRGTGSEKLPLWAATPSRGYAGDEHELLCESLAIPRFENKRENPVATHISASR